MGDTLPNPQDPDFLDGWKDIAAFLGKNERTARRWEQDEGMPVHRLPHAKRDSVTASKREIQSWLEQRTRRAHEAVPPTTGSPPSLEQSAGWQSRTPTFYLRLMAVTIAAGVLAYGLSRTWSWAPSRADETADASYPTRIFAGVTSETGRLEWHALGGAPHTVHIPRNSLHAYISLYDTNEIVVVRLDDLAIERRLAVSPSPVNMASDPSGRFVVVSHESESVVSVIETKNWEAKTIATPGRVRGATVDSRLVAYLPMDQTGLWRLELISGNLTRIHEVVCPKAAALSEDEKLLYVSCQCGAPRGIEGHDGVDVISLETLKSVRTFQGPPMVGSSITLANRGHHLWLDGGDACQSKAYDHVGCPAVPAGVSHLLRISDGSFLRSMPHPERSNFLVVPDGSRVTVLDGGPITIHDGATGNPQEALRERVNSIAFDFSSPLVVMTSLERRSVARVDVGAKKWDPPHKSLANWLTGDGVGADRIGSMHFVSPHSFAPGRVGYAFRLAGTPLRFAPSRSGDLYLVDSTTLACWIKPDSDKGEYSVVSQFQSGRVGSWRVKVDDGSLAFEVSGQTLIRSTKTVRAGAWSHVAISRKGDSCDLFLNGTKIGAVPFVSTAERYPALVVGDKFQGLIDEFTIHTMSFEAAFDGALHSLRNHACPN